MSRSAGTTTEGPRAGRLSDEQVAVGIMRSARGPNGASKDYSSYLDRLPDLAERPVVLDAALSAALGSPHLPEPVQLERARRLKTRFPEFAVEIDRTLWLNRMFDPHHAAKDEGCEGEKPIPRSLGPVLADGDGRYVLQREIGSGANGRVFIAHDRLLSCDDGTPALVAIKLVNGGRGVTKDRALSEARRMRLVEHRNVVRVSDVGQTNNGRSYIVQEYVQGRNLGEWLDSHRPSVRRIVAMIAEVADGVQAIHAAGLVHHDLKPQNILVGEDGSIKVADFGSSAWQYSGGAGRASPGPGTLAFMAPEMLRMLDVAPMPCSDVFSLGAFLFWALARRPVAGEDAASALAALADRSDEFADLEYRLCRAKIDHDLRLIIRRAVSVRIEARYPSAGALAEDLRAWLGRRPIGWTKPGLARRARLLVRRRPVALSACGVIAASLVFAGVSARSASLHAAAARQSEQAAALEHERYSTEIAWKKKTAKSLRRLLSKFAVVKRQGLESEVLTSLWLLEWSHGPMLLDNPEMLKDIWQARIDVLEQKRAALLTIGGRGAIEAKLIEPSLAMWYIRAGRAGEAAAMLDGSLSSWEQICDPDDPWLVQLRVLRAAAGVHVALDEGGPVSGGDIDGDLDLLRRFVASPPATIDKPIIKLARTTLKAIPR